MRKILLCAALLVNGVSSVKAQPAGTIIAYAGEVNTVPKGYLVCDGREYTTKQYKELFKAIGIAWGTSGNGKFNVPDLRGLFLRGVNANRADQFKDPDAKDRKSMNTNGNAGNAVGSVQLDAIQNHTHKGGSNVSVTLGGQPIVQYWNTESPNPQNGGSNMAGTPIAPTGEREVEVKTETRSKNAYVNFLIKVKN